MSATAPLLRRNLLTVLEGNVSTRYGLPASAVAAGLIRFAHRLTPEEVKLALDELVAEGFATRVFKPLNGEHVYWISDAGRAALQDA